MLIQSTSLQKNPQVVPVNLEWIKHQSRDNYVSKLYIVNVYLIGQTRMLLVHHKHAMKGQEMHECEVYPSFLMIERDSDGGVSQGIALYETNSPQGCGNPWVQTKHLSPFPSVDLCFLSVVTRTSRCSLRGKPGEKRGLEATGELRIRSKSSAKGSSSCLYPFPTLFPLPLFPPLSSGLYYVDPADVVYFTSILRALLFLRANEPPPCPARSPSGSGELSLWMYTSSIRYRRLMCSFQYESLSDAL